MNQIQVILLLVGLAFSLTRRHHSGSKYRRMARGMDARDRTHWQHPHRRLRRKKKGFDDEECNSCEHKSDKVIVSEMKSDVLSLTTTISKLKSTITTMSTTIETLRTEIRTIKQRCDQQWDPDTNRMSKAKLMRNYKPGWITYTATNYPMTKQQKALEALGTPDIQNSKTQAMTQDTKSQFVGGSADHRRRMFSFIDLGQMTRLSQIMAWANFDDKLYLDKITAYAYTKDTPPLLDAMRSKDFELLGQVSFSRASPMVVQDGHPLYSDPGVINFPPVMARYLWFDLDNEKDLAKCRCVAVAAWKAFS